MTSVLASREAGGTQAMCETPPRSPTMVGIAVETMVWSRLETSIPAISAAKTRLIRRRVRTNSGASSGAVGVGACTRLRGSVGCGGQAAGEDVPRLVDEAGQGVGEAAGEPAGQGGAQHRAAGERQQRRQGVGVDVGAGALGDGGGQGAVGLAEVG